jgi:hypothetical protein
VHDRRCRRRRDGGMGYGVGDSVATMTSASSRGFS